MTDPSFEKYSSKGLNSEEAFKRLKRFGPNELSSQKESFWKVILSVITEPMLSLLILCGILYAVLGNLEEAGMLSIAVVAVISITIYQNNKSQNALASLKELAPLKARVIRDGKISILPSREVVPDDVIILQEGDRISADGFLIFSLNLNVDESLLTGESVSIPKESKTDSEKNIQNSADTKSLVFAGSTVVAGEGMFQVTATGDSTEIGKIGKELQTISQSSSPLQTEIKRFTIAFSLFAGILCVFLVVGLGLRHGRWLEAFLAGLTFSMAVLPEEIPVVLSVFFSLGAWRISKIGVLTKNLSAIETLGASTVLCVDKTGTLTENNMKVRGLYCEGEFLECNSKLLEIPEKFHSLLEFALLASKKDPYDPMEKAIQDLGVTFLSGTEHIHFDWELKKEYPLSPKLMALSYAWLSRENEDVLFVGAKGAPEAIFDLCHFPQELLNEWEAVVEKYSSRGFRILGVAKSKTKTRGIPDDQHDLSFDFLGLVLLEDPIRESVPASVLECKRAGIKVVMITGDHAGTAKSIADQIGFDRSETVLGGDELEALSEDELLSRLDHVRIFCRIRPHQKLKIVRCLQRKGETVAMTGDGVNDTLALHAAHIGISMGKRGTDVAREASDLVLLDDNFSSIVKAVMLGRRIYENIQKSVSYIISVHIPIIGMSLLPVLTGDPLYFFPAHVLLLELIIDPACTLVFEGVDAEKHIYASPPRKGKESLISFRNASVSLLRGGLIFLVLVGLSFWGKHEHWSFEKIRSMAFLCLISSNLGMILIHLSKDLPFYKVLSRSNSILFWICGSTVLILTLIFHVDLLTHIFGFIRISFADIFSSVALGLFVSLIWESKKIKDNS
ncbi:cation-translocating P-type ATPase [Leptospira adleri]|uniref:cation-translocating P-type ATPase n=1 Tax=Leptospira adleri TaxID=2023186 RepID=UPI0010847FC6|nr:cation-translocating P-type ATPase [Leptospira adleri]TGM58502.1 cation-translocating P-type ATPase [Leptospira adleri]